MPYTMRKSLKKSVNLPFYTFSKHAHLNTLILRVATVYTYFNFQPRVRTNSAALFSHNEMQTFLKRLANII